MAVHYLVQGTPALQAKLMFKKIFLIDCPGVVTPAKDESEDNIVLKGVVRVENLDDPAMYIPALLERCKKVSICFVTVIHVARNTSKRLTESWIGKVL